ncbi:hypothetical protein [Lewinella sp. LCG006]|uniref:hypothetical protein n=1 Tax=Lewinella sp. LCG006 TaxID=3231911 RepID=UPI00345F84D0
MDKEAFEEEYSRYTDYLDQCRTSMIEDARKSHPDVIEANKTYSSRITELDRNWAMVPIYDPEKHKHQRNDLLESRNQVENDAIREAFTNVKEEALENYFYREPALQEEARKRVDTSPKYQWLKQQEQQPQVGQNQENTIQQEFTQEAGTPIPSAQQQFQAQRGEAKAGIDGKEDIQTKGEFQDREAKAAEKITDIDKFPGYGAPSTVKEPEGGRETLETTLELDSSDYPGYGSTYASETSSPPQKGITYTPPKDGPTME